MSNENQAGYKVLVVGDDGVGKASLVVQFSKGSL